MIFSEAEYKVLHLRRMTEVKHEEKLVRLQAVWKGWVFIVD